MRRRVLLAVIVVASVGVQLALLLPNAQLPLKNDELRYVFSAASIRQGTGLPGSSRPPGYPYALALAASLAPEGTPPRLSAGVLQIAFSALTLLVVYGLTLCVFDSRAAVAAAAIFGLYPTLAAHTHLLWSETCQLLPLAGALLALIRARRTRSLRWALAAGALLGVAALTREFVFWFVPVAGVWLLMADAAQLRRPLAGALVGVGALLVILPWSARNLSEQGSFVFITTNTWTPLFIANNDDPRWNPATHVRFYEEWGDREIDRERHARSHALRTIASRQPGWIFERLARNLPALFGVDTFPLRHLRKGWYGPTSPALRWTAAGVTALTYAALLVAAILGLWGTRWNAERILLLLFLAYASAVMMPFWVVSRYRLPLLVAAIPFAAAWSSRAEGIERPLPRGPRFALAAGSVALALLLAFLEADRTLLPLLRGS